MEDLQCRHAPLLLGIAKHVQGDVVGEVRLSADAIHGLLHFAVVTVATLDRVRRRGQQFIIEERQRVLQVRRVQLTQDLADVLEAAATLAQLGQFCQRRVHAAAAIEQTVDFLYQRPQHLQPWQTTSEVLQSMSWSRGQIVLDEEITMGKEVADLLLQPLTLTHGTLGGGCSGPAPLHGRPTRGELFTHYGHSAQDRLCEFLQDVERTDLVRHRAKHHPQWLGIQRRPIRRHSLHGQLALGQKLRKTPQCLGAPAPDRGLHTGAA